MKRVVGQQLDQLKAKSGGYVALLVYRYANLCIEANPFALLSVEVTVEGESKKIEEVAKVAVHEKYHFIVEPLYEEDFFAVGKAIMETHPEFKQEIKSYDGFDAEDPEGKFLFYTMPEVNKDRHDALLKAVDAFYDECKDKMDAAKQACVAKLAILQQDASPEEIEKTSEMVDQIMKQYNDYRDSAHDGKKQEVENAYADYQKQQEEQQAEEQEKQQEQGNPMQMKFGED